MTNVVGSAFLGVTLGCARCHDLSSIPSGRRIITESRPSSRIPSRKTSLCINRKSRRRGSRRRAQSKRNWPNYARRCRRWMVRSGRPSSDACQEKETRRARAASGSYRGAGRSETVCPGPCAGAGKTPMRLWKKLAPGSRRDAAGWRSRADRRHTAASPGAGQLDCRSQ